MIAPIDTHTSHTTHTPPLPILTFPSQSHKYRSLGGYPVCYVSAIHRNGLDDLMDEIVAQVRKGECL